MHNILYIIYIANNFAKKNEAYGRIHIHNIYIFGGFLSIFYLNVYFHAFLK